MHSKIAFLITAIFSQQLWAMHVVLDPGHGGTDHGTTRGGITESQITLQVAQYLSAELEKDGAFTVTMTRNKDTFLTLEERASIANKNGDVFVSIHVNSSSNPHVYGEEIYFQNQLPPDEESLFLASRENEDNKLGDVIHAQSPALKGKKNLNTDVRGIVGDLERNHNLKLSGILTEFIHHNWAGRRHQQHRAVRQAPFFVVSNIDKPAILIEIGYLTNPEEAKKLIDPEYQKKIALGIYQALLSFKEFVDKPANKSLN